MRSLENEFAEWATENGFVNSVHDAAFEGVIDGVPVSLDTGFRHGRPFTTIVRIEQGTGEPPRNLHRNDPPGDDSVIVRALRCAILADDALLVVWADPTRLTVRSRCQDPERLAAALRRLVHALHEHAASGPYR